MKDALCCLAMVGAVSAQSIAGSICEPRPDNAGSTTEVADFPASVPVGIAVSVSPTNLKASVVYVVRTPSGPTYAGRPALQKMHIEGLECWGYVGFAHNGQQHTNRYIDIHGGSIKAASIGLKHIDLLSTNLVDGCMQTREYGKVKVLLPPVGAGTGSRVALTRGYYEKLSDDEAEKAPSRKKRP